MQHNNLKQRNPLNLFYAILFYFPLFWSALSNARVVRSYYDQTDRLVVHFVLQNDERRYILDVIDSLIKSSSYAFKLQGLDQLFENSRELLHFISVYKSRR